MNKRKYLTREGYEKLRKELTHMKQVKRPEISKQIGEARAHGDISENAEYDAAKDAQGHLEAKIHRLENSLSGATIIDDEQIPDDKVYVGAIVDLKDIDRGRELRYTLVDEEEADYSQGKISISAPVGRGLLGSKEGDTITINVPSGTLRYLILKISR